MKSMLVVMTVLLGMGGKFTEYDVSEKEEITKTLQFPAGGSGRELVVDNINGSIRAEGYSGDALQLVVHRTSFGSSDARLQEAKRKITLEIREEPGKIVLYVNTPWRCSDGSIKWQGGNVGYDADFDFELKVPAKTDFSLKTVNKGSIQVKNLEGAFEVSNVNGGIEMDEITGAGLATTVNGPVDVRFNKNPQAKCGFRTVNGPIEVQMPGDLSADLRLKTFNGEVYTDFDVTGLSRQPHHPQRIGRKNVYRSDDFFTVRAGSGGPELVFDTLNGDIRILRAHN